MAYTKQTWADNDPTKPVSAARMQHIEDGLDAVANGGSLSLVFNVKDLYGADNTGVVDATTSIQNALNAAHTAGGGTVYLPRGSYLISASLVIYSNTTFELDTNATITLKAGSSCNMIHNAAWVAGSGRDNDIEILNGTWDAGNNSGGTGQQLHAILLQRIDGLMVSPNVVKSTGGKYAICIYACTEFDVARIDLNCFSDGVHIDGASAGGHIHDIWGTSGDDTVALSPVDWPAYQNGDFGDITDISIENVFATQTNNTSAVHLFAGSTNSGATPWNLHRIRVENIRGNTPGAGCVSIGGDVTFSATQFGNIYDITVAHVTNDNTSAVGLVKVGNLGAGTVISGLDFSHLQQGAARNVVTFDASSAACTVRHVNIHDCQFGPANAGASPVIVNNGAVVEHLDLNDIYAEWTTSTYLVKLAGTGSTVNTLKAKNIRLNVVGASSGGLVVTAAATAQVLGNLYVDGYTVDRCAWTLGDFGMATSTNAYLKGIQVGTVSGLAFVRTGATLNVLTAEGLTGTNVFLNGSVGTMNWSLKPKATPAYSASITPSVAGGPWQTITVANATAFTVNAPTEPPDATHSAALTVEILNSSGGAMGVITWNAAFVFAGFIWANPASTKKRFVRFEWNGVAWVATSMSSADY